MKKTQITGICERLEGKYNYKVLARLSYDLDRVGQQSLDILENELRR